MGYRPNIHFGIIVLVICFTFSIYASTSPEPEITAEPESIAEITSQPEVLPESEPTPEAGANSEPKVTSEPEVSSKLELTPAAEVTAEPEVTSESKPEVTSEPEGSPEPELSGNITLSAEPESTSEPEGTPQLEVEPRAEGTAEPEVVSEPRSTSEPEANELTNPEVTAEAEQNTVTVTISEPSSEPERSNTSNPEPNAEPDSEPEDGNSSISKPNAEFGAEPEGGNSSISEPESEPRADPEPVPEWSIAIVKWGVLWYIHVYLSNVCYFLIFLTTLVVLVEVTKTWRTKRKPLTICLGIFLFLFSSCRVAILVTDPYNYKNLMQRLVWRVLWVLPYPALTTSFCVVLLVLVDTTKMSIAPPRFQRLSSILIIATIHFCFVLGAEFIVFWFMDMTILLFLCQLLTFTWGLVLVAGYAAVGVKIHRNLSSSLNSSAHKDEETEKILRLRRIIFLSSLTGLAYSLTGLYGAIGVYGLMGSRGDVIAPWPWWVFQTFSRLTEIAMCVLTISVALRTPNVAVFRPIKQLYGHVMGKCRKRGNRVQSDTQGATVVVGNDHSKNV